MKRLIGSALAMLAAIGAAQADDFASRKITIVVPYAAGGAMDAVGRVVGEQLHQRFGVITVVDNRVGANGVLGMTYVAKASPDGYTLMISSEVGQAIQPAIDPSFPLDSLNTFTPGFTGRNVPPFPRGAKSSQRELCCGVPDAREGQPRQAQLRQQRSRHDCPRWHGVAQDAGRPGYCKHSLSRGNGRDDRPHSREGGCEYPEPAQYGVTVGEPVIEDIGDLERRTRQRFPDIPTMIESGFPGFVFVSWTAVFGPPGMPPDIVAKISGSLSEGVKTSQGRREFAEYRIRRRGADSLRA